MPEPPRRDDMAKHCRPRFSHEYGARTQETLPEGGQRVPECPGRGGYPPVWSVSRCALLPASQLSVLTADKASQSLGVQLSLAQLPQTATLVIAVSPVPLRPLPSHPSALASPTRDRPGANYPPWPALACFALPGALGSGQLLSASGHKAAGPVQIYGLSSSRLQQPGRRLSC